MHKEFQPIRFPEDESAHDYVVEWWYFNGHLKDGQGHEYSFMDCLFQVDVKKVKIPFLKQIPLKKSYFSHSLLTDLTNKEFHHRISPFSIISDDSFSRPLLFINYINPEIKNGYVNCVIEKIGEATYHLKNEDMDLILTSVKQPVLEGGNGYLDLHSKTTYYYSLTNLKTEGRIKIKNQWIDVSGKSWMDHQWADTAYSKDRWDWFSIQLDDDAEIVCYMYDDGKVKTYGADISYADGKQEHHKDIEIAASGESWVSPKSKAIYPLEWKVYIPSNDLELSLKAKIKDQEMLFGSINYWEGPLTVAGRFGQKNIKGVGFMELVGYPSRYTNMKYVSDEVSKTAGLFISAAKTKTRSLASGIKRQISGKTPNDTIE